MKTELVRKLYSEFERVGHTEQGVEYCFARDLQVLLGYVRWRNFEQVIERAKTACGDAGQRVEDHFAEARKMVDVGSGARRPIIATMEMDVTRMLREVVG
jgi:DNA-damage-inducible protein D